MDQIKIKELEVFANHGVFPEENHLGQKFVISLCLEVDARVAGNSDDIQQSVDYGAVAELVTKETKAHTFQLIEKLAEHLAREVLIEFPLVKQVEMEVAKPWAPVKLPLKTVSVTIKRGWQRVYLGIGSNLGDKEAYLKKAIELLEQRDDVLIGRVSDFIVTKPVGGVEQDDFLNGAIEIQTLLGPEELLDVLAEIEKELGRVRDVHWGPRTIDLDILLYGDQCIATERLIVPHREMCGRLFVLKPLAQIAPYVMHPVKQKCIQELCDQEMEAAHGEF